MGNRRSIRGLVVDKKTQSKMAIYSTSLVLVPSLFLSTVLLTNLATEAANLMEGPMSQDDVTHFLHKAITYTTANLVLFGVLAVISFVVSVKLSNYIIGPVDRLERYLRAMIAGDYSQKTNLREGDYLAEVGLLLDQLAESLRTRKEI